jgi:hypothetical protein
VDCPVNIECGKEYYIRCTLNMGVMVGRPDMVLVDPAAGKIEFDAVR